MEMVAVTAEEMMVLAEVEAVWSDYDIACGYSGCACFTSLLVDMRSRICELIIGSFGSGVVDEADDRLVRRLGHTCTGPSMLGACLTRKLVSSAGNTCSPRLVVELTECPTSTVHL